MYLSCTQCWDWASSAGTVGGHLPREISCTAYIKATDIAIPAHRCSECARYLFNSSSQVPVDFWLCSGLHCMFLPELVIFWDGLKCKWEYELLIGKRQMKCQPLSQHSPNIKDWWQWAELKLQLLWCHLDINWGAGECKEQQMLWKRGEEPDRKRVAQVPGSFTGMHPSALCCGSRSLQITPVSTGPLSSWTCWQFSG